jgi:hypothetical protein
MLAQKSRTKPRLCVHALSCGSKSALQEVVQVVAAIKQHVPPYPLSVEQSDWLKAIKAAALKIENHQLNVIANVWKEPEDWKFMCAKKNPKGNP